MPSKYELEEQEEAMRAKVRMLNDEQRARFYRLVEERLKDPDTYATLNYIFIAGLHHFYIGKWFRGLMNIAIFWGGVVAIFMGAWKMGLGIIAAITVFEFYELFRSQAIVQYHNNKLMEEIYNEVS